MKKLYLLLFCLLPLSMQAQDYRTAFGVRLGFSKGLTIKHVVQDHQAIEGILSTRWKGYHLIGLYEWHKDMINDLRSGNLCWFYGIGAHVGYYPTVQYYYNPNGVYYTTSVTPVGIDGIIGLEYMFTRFPLVVSLDAKPYFEFIYPGPDFIDVALSARFYIE